MATSAWVFMIIVWGIVIGTTVYCFKKLLTSEHRLDSGDDSD